MYKLCPSTINFYLYHRQHLLLLSASTLDIDFTKTAINVVLSRTKGFQAVRRFISGDPFFVTKGRSFCFLGNRSSKPHVTS